MPGKLRHLFAPMHGRLIRSGFSPPLNGGRTVSKYRKNQTVFSQGDSVGTVFYIQDGKVKITVRKA
jgi:CRP-like cAMP-binding protein